MRFIDISDIESKISQDWKDKASSLYVELEKIDDVDQKHEFIKKNNIWSEIKPVLKEISWWKCWYSEAKDIVSDYDVDHYRPKWRIKNKEWNIIEHDWYWWLAFDINNYRFSWIFMNRPRWGWWKVDYFPINDENFRATFWWIQVNYETPLILDPTNEDDCSLIAWDINTWELFPFSDDQESLDYKKANFSIDVLNLNHENLVEARKQLFNTFKRYKSSYMEWQREILKREAWVQAKSNIRELLKDNAEFSNIVRTLCLLDSELKVRQLPIT